MEVCHCADCFIRVLSERDAADAALASLEAEYHWRRVRFEMPEKYEAVLGFREGGEIEVVRSDGLGGWFNFESDSIRDVTHWMPLPAAPEEAGE